MYIYVVTMVRGLFEPKRIITVKKGINQIYTDKRCVGYFWECDDVISNVLFNEMMWEEGYYKYCVIERITQGIHIPDLMPLWINGIGEVIKTPNGYAQSYCFGIG